MSIIIAGERSGVGKTTVTLTLLASLRRRGVKVQSFKVGPDYIDPMFHQYVTGLPCRNLDPVLTSETYVQQCFNHHSPKSEYTLVEGVMGLFDGIAHLSNTNEKTDFASTAHIARLLDIPTILVIDCSRLSGSVAAIAHGYCSLDKRIKIAGLVLNRVGSDRHLSLLKDALVPLQLPILGVLRRQDNITIPDRHLGLIPTTELPELDQIINRLADLGDIYFDWDKLLPLLKSASLSSPNSQFPIPNSGVKIAVARDQAFNFYYQDNLDLLEKLGAELVFWSPLNDTQLPKDIQGMYFGGGFPEVFAPQLSANINLIQAVKNSILAGIPTIAECGGLMYLCEQIIDFDGKSWPMVGILPTEAKMDKRLTLGYRRAVVLENTFLVDSNKNIFGHEFHRSHLITNSPQPLFNTYRYDGDENTGFEGWYLPNVHASYIHQHWGESGDIPNRFIQECLKNQKI
ncbi:MAG: cobyrinic acid a,c-diamide synthase [Aphanizomenon flos-aquae MDT14a]|jgi:cobyrinic acid a,c-diamide synthase|uniref:Cobyrinate a,c-diamide synthase n=1 Tax=Aphanizomenon flos-aquae LD13 TaxID=1710894 RepID=A0A1B7VVF8_APHFL|nr:cobyrinate a,c-diamide synthase [Aphanizomenon flos-aquae UKL13-PB]MBO1060967.1 cobyrinate a,c-diamide synthase [Aphanizomenon flos-aquae CP01]OBQ24885.1 MAG: cobyrinic acid a,c-diamide synthase [Aphanizomenon flos-aquae LD13]OBQ29955.1 MAG: cobyrinic acid a,c-diamide synthase [Aphanizomenon flos-aquae MDT14a]HCQ22006.1 cobyrinic acid a,c-diamide synthase [Anabaena sp. UBA12330]